MGTTKGSDRGTVTHLGSVVRREEGGGQLWQIAKPLRGRSGANATSRAFRRRLLVERRTRVLVVTRIPCLLGYSTTRQGAISRASIWPSVACHPFWPAIKPTGPRRAPLSLEAAPRLPRRAASHSNRPSIRPGFSHRIGAITKAGCAHASLVSAKPPRTRAQDATCKSGLAFTSLSCSAPLVFSEHGETVSLQEPHRISAVLLHILLCSTDRDWCMCYGHDATLGASASNTHLGLLRLAFPTFFHTSSLDRPLNYGEAGAPLRRVPGVQLQHLSGRRSPKNMIIRDISFLP